MENRLHLLLNSNRGSAMLALLVFSAIAAGLLGAATSIAVRQAREASAHIDRLQREEAERHSLNQALRTMESSDDPPTAAASIPNLASARVSNTAPSLIHLKSATDSSPQDGGLGLLLALKAGNDSSPPRADWGRLEADLRSEATCTSWRDEASCPGGSRICAGRTCRALLPPLRRSTLLPGNIRLEDELAISSTQDLALLFAARGDIALEGGLRFQNTSGATIALIAAGDVLIRALRVEASRDVRLLIYSAAGDIRIEDEGAQGFLFPGGGGESPLYLRLEAAGSIYLGSTSFESQHALGYPFPRSPRYWPKLKVLGRTF